MIKYFNELVAELQSKGTIFGAEYRKKNGELTKINGRFGVSKFVKGTGTSNPNVLTVWTIIVSVTLRLSQITLYA